MNGFCSKKHLSVARFGVAGLWLCAGAAGAMAQDLDCSNPVSQVEMTGCASLSYEAADAELNMVWKQAMAGARAMDSYGVPDGQPTAADLLRQAQRSWITFRDEACEVESYLARGGTMQNQIFLMCLERQTRQRTEDLRYFSEMN